MKHLAFGKPLPTQRLPEAFQLRSLVGPLHAGMVEGKLAVEHFIDKVRLPDASTAIDRHKLGLWRRKPASEFFDFALATDHENLRSTFFEVKSADIIPYQI
jgi:hypothetical protein